MQTPVTSTPQFQTVIMSKIYVIFVSIEVDACLEIHISHSMRTLMRKGRYSIGINEDFDGVIRGCSKTNGRYWEDGAWLGENIIQAFTALHKQGFAASVEVWDNETDGNDR